MQAESIKHGKSKIIIKSHTLVTLCFREMGYPDIVESQEWSEEYSGVECQAWTKNEKESVAIDTPSLFIIPEV